MSMRLVIVGAGGFGRELHSWVVTAPDWRAANEINGIVYVDDEVPVVPVSAPITATISSYIPEAGDRFLCAIGDPSARHRVTADLTARGAKRASFVHDRALVGENVALGMGVVICPDVILSNNIAVGNDVHINTGSAIGHDVRIDEGCTLSSAVNLTGNVHVKRQVFVGTAATILPGRVIGEYAKIGAGSVVTKNVEANMTVFGNPARVVGKADR